MNDARVAWQATFHAPAVGLAQLRSAADPWARWARGVLLQASGEYAEAFGLWEPLTGSGDELAGLAAARLGSGLRQLDEHAVATGWDDVARNAVGRAVADGLIGRAADAVGLADASQAARFLDQARAHCNGPRDRVRVAWVACEIELLGGRATDAARHAEHALRISADQPWPRHQTKSALFLGAALREVDPERATRLLHDAARQAQQLSLRPLLWPLALVLGDDATPEERLWAARAVRVIAARLPPGVGSGWAARPDVAHLLATRGP